MKKLLKQFLIIILIFIAFSAIISAVRGNDSSFKEKTKTEDITALVRYLEAEKVEKIEISDNIVKVKLKEGGEVKILKEAGQNLTSLLRDYNVNSDKLKQVPLSITNPSNLSVAAANIFPIILPFLIIGVIFFLIFRQAKQAGSQAMMFGESQARLSNFKKTNGKAKEDKNKITFKQVAGVTEAKEELLEIVDFLKNPQKFTKIGAKTPRGVLLVGPPGTGKTMLAKAVSYEAEVPFFNISGSEFMEMFVGVGASRVRSLFNKAKKNAPCIIFIDEIDAIGRHRGVSSLGGIHDEREQTLNQILVEMDGFDTDTNVIIIAATNRPDVLDSALLRPGRFDRRIVLELPDIRDRVSILKIHSQGKPIDPQVNFQMIAERTAGFSGADLANLINEAAILTARQNKSKITMTEILPSIEKVLLGPEKKNRVITDKEKKITAYHEASHALTSHLLPHSDPIHKISIIARGQAGGYILKVPAYDRHLHSKSEFLDDITVALAGYAAEQIIFQETTTGATADLKQATDLARRLVTDYGMSDSLGPQTFGDKEEIKFLGRSAEDRNYSEKTAQIIDEEIAKILNRSLKKAQDLIAANKSRLDIIAKTLLQKETIEKEEFEGLMGQAG